MMSALGEVQLRDGRFVMLPTQRIEGTRNAIGGLLRQRALWLLGCLHLLSDAQRHDLGGSAAIASREALCVMSGLSPKSLTRITRALIAERILEVQRPVGPAGSLPSVYRLLGANDGPRVIITHPALRLMQSKITPGRLSGAFATYLTIAELLNEQRSTTATASRQLMARRVGVSSARSIDEYVDALRRAGLVRKHSHSDRHGQQPAIWELTEPGAERDPQATTEAAGAPAASNGQPSDRPPRTDPAQLGNRALAAGEQPPCSSETTLVQRGNRPDAAAEQPLCSQGTGGDAECTPPQALSAAPIAHTGDDGQDIEHQDSLDPQTLQLDVGRGGGDQDVQQAELLCEHFAASLARRATPAILRRPGGWLVAADAWRRGASAVLAEVELQRALRAIDCIEVDAFLARHVRSMPALAERLDEVLLCLSAVEARSRSAVRGDNAQGDAPAWAEARQQITAAIRRHGTRRAAATADLSRLHPAYESFIALVGWTNLCREDPQRRQWDWQQAWKQACQSPTPSDSSEEAA
jgi:hypothetical protein